MPRLVLLPISGASPRSRSHPQHDDLAGFHASPLYSWWIAVADGFLSLKNPVRRAWWIAPDLAHPCAHSPSPPPPPQRYARKGKTNSEMWTRSWFIKYRWSSAFLTLALKSLDISAMTVSICTSCVNTNMVGVKTFVKKKKEKDERSSGPAIILFTMDTHDGVTSTFLISRNFTQQRAGEGGAVWVWWANSKSF